MGYYVTNIKTSKYRVTVEELTTWTENPERDELEKPLPEGGQKAKPRERQEWKETDCITSASPQVIAGLLRAKAEELDPKKPAMRGFDA